MAEPISAPDQYTDFLVRLRAGKDPEEYQTETWINGEPAGEGPPRRLPVAAAAKEVRQIGSDLFSFLFDPESSSGKAYRRALDTAKERTEGRLRFRLSLEGESATLETVPWETLQDARRSPPVPFAASELSPFSRFVEGKATPPPPLTERPIRMLVAVPNPPDLPPIAVAETISQLAEALKEPVGSGQLQMTVLSGRTEWPSPTQDVLMRDGYILQGGAVTLEAISALAPRHDLVYLAAYGSVGPMGKQDAGTASAYLEDKKGQKDEVPGSELAKGLTATRYGPRLVLLSTRAIGKDEAGQRDAGISLGSTLSRAGVPAVVAMQHLNVTGYDDIQVAALFYRQLLEHGLVDLAMNQARAFVWQQLGSNRDALVPSPVLWMRLTDGRLLTPAAARGPARAQTEKAPPDKQESPKTAEPTRIEPEVVPAKPTPSPSQPAKRTGTGSRRGRTGGTGQTSPVVVMQQYEPPPPRPANKVTVEVYTKTVVLEYAGTRYSGPNRLDDRAYRALATAWNNFDVDDYGQQLFNAIIHGGVSAGGSPEHTTLQGYGEALRRGNRGLRFELLLDPNDLKINQVYWEYLKPARQTPLALLANSPFYRRFLERNDKLDIGGGPLRVLAAICNPTDLGQGNNPANPILEKLTRLIVPEERQLLAKALTWQAGHPPIEYEVLDNELGPPVTLDALRRALPGYHVLHLLCHGLYLEGKPEFYLVMEDGDRKHSFVPAGDFVDTLRVGADLRLIVLAACQSAVSNTGSALFGLGPRLVREAKIPAVLAMQANLPVPTAQLFTQHFYDDLARSGRLDMAVAVTRLAIAQSKERQDSGTWGIPVLLMSTDDGKLLDPNPTLPERRPDVQTSGLPAVPAGRLPEVLPEAQPPPPPRSADEILSAMGAAAMGTIIERVMALPAPPPPAKAVPLACEQLRAAITGNLQRAVAIKVEDEPGPPVIEGLQAFVEREENGGLKLDPSAFHQLASALNTGKHIILIGPPGTGKTTLALAICKFAKERGFSQGTTYASATADWTTFDTVGGYVPTASQALEFRPGIFLRALCEANWLVIDEINRAEIDKAFGELFTVLSGQRVDLPYKVGESDVRILPPAGKDPANWIPPDETTNLPVTSGYDYVVHPNWRVVGTMNVYDKSSLYSMSLAFMRRFAFVDVDLPEPNLYETLQDKWIAEGANLGALGAPEKADLKTLVGRILKRDSMLMKKRALGPAIVKDMIAYVDDRYPAKGAENSLGLLAEAFLLYAVPQLDGLDQTAITGIYTELSGIFGDKFGEGQRGISGRVRALYPFIPEDQWVA